MRTKNISLTFSVSLYWRKSINNVGTYKYNLYWKIGKKIGTFGELDDLDLPLDWEREREKYREIKIEDREDRGKT